MPPPRKKRPPAGQPVPGAETIYAHRDALRRSSGAAGQKPPGRGRKNNHGQGDWGTYTPWESGRQWGVWCRKATARAARQDRGHAWAQKTAPSGGRRLCTGCAMGERRTSCAGWCLGSITLGARRDRGHARAQKQPPAGAGGCLNAGYGCYLPRAIRVIWMHRVGSTARPRIMPS